MDQSGTLPLWCYNSMELCPGWVADGNAHPPTYLGHHLLIEDTWTGVAQQSGKNCMDARQRSILLPTQTPSAENKTSAECSHLSTRSGP